MQCILEGASHVQWFGLCWQAAEAGPGLLHNLGNQVGHCIVVSVRVRSPGCRRSGHLWCSYLFPPVLAVLCLGGGAAAETLRAGG